MATRSPCTPSKPEIVSRLDAMSPAERLAASRTTFTPHERAVWAARFPDEVPLVNDEYEWIALLSADRDQVEPLPSLELDVLRGRWAPLSVLTPRLV